MNQLMVRERRLITTLGVLTCVFVGGVWHSKREASAQAWAAGTYIHPDGVVEPSQAQKEVDAALVKSATDKAQRFRDKFRPWALQHRALIQKMLDAAPTGMAARKAVVDALPMNEVEAGFDNRDFDGRAMPPFSWGASGKWMTRSAPGVQAWIGKSPENAKLWDRLEKQGPKMAAQGFAEFRDYGIATSVNSGRYTIRLWASGRITKTYYTGKAPKPGRENLDTVTTEIVPPYDFLQPRVPFNKDADADSTKGA